MKDLSSSAKLKSLISICGALRDLVRSAQLKKREKHPWRSITFSKVAGFKKKFLTISLTHFKPMFPFYTP